MRSSIHLDRRRLIAALAGVPALALALAAPAGAQVPTGDLNAYEAEAVAVALAELEIAGDYGTLYGALHPDSRALISEAGVAGWYDAEFAPRNPGPVSAILSSETIDWTWNVTGVTYPGVSEVTYTQPFDGIEEEVVVRLARSNGFLTWFFGRDRAFVEEQEARFGDGDVLTRPDPQELADTIAALDRSAVEPYILGDDLTFRQVDIRFPDPESGATGDKPIVILAMTVGYAGAGTSSQVAGEIALSVAAYPNEGQASANYNRNLPAGSDGQPEGIYEATLTNGDGIRLAYGEPFALDGGVHTSAQAQIDTVIVRAIYDGVDGSEVVDATCRVAVCGVEILHAVLSGEID